jgi:hydroxymethylbilane synthase
MTAARDVIRLGTRGSPLALIQAHEVRDRLIAAHSKLATAGAIEVVAIHTTGDRVQDRTLADIGGKGLFTKEIEEWLLDGRIDMAIHSMKDVPTWIPDRLSIACMLPRADPRDTFIGRDAGGLDTLPQGAVVGTASIRRQSQILKRRPDLRVIPFRGNVQTRLRKLNERQADATLLAQAGLDRLGLAMGAVLSPEELLPAVAQGAIGVEIRADDDRARQLLEPLDDRPTTIAVNAERAVLAALDGSCRTPIAALALPEGGKIHLRALVAMPDGSMLWQTARRVVVSDAVHAGRDAGEELRRNVGDRFAFLRV